MNQTREMGECYKQREEKKQVKTLKVREIEFGESMDLKYTCYAQINTTVYVYLLCRWSGGEGVFVIDN